MMMKKIFAFILIAAGLASAYTVTPSGTSGYGYFTVNGQTTSTNAFYEVSGLVTLGFVSTNGAYQAIGVSVNGQPNRGLQPWGINVDGNATVSPIIGRVPPKPFLVPSGVYSISVTASSNEWAKVVFGAPNQVNFVNDGSSYLYPATVDAVLLQAVGGDIEIGTSTNDTVTVSTLGDPAEIPTSRITVGDGSGVTINTQITELYLKGSGKATITGVKQ